ncbi:unnamed protein product [Owenia fusiformis]|uniref:p53 DNA-binding domain-containing protein n=1 Tax=Owenia fusiformis TaxID=6347 RepID=A0A8S4PGE7_OWEFU|nr:unnamed protein product [Owenia fusiformis]
MNMNGIKSNGNNSVRMSEEFGKRQQGFSTHAFIPAINTSAYVPEFGGTFGFSSLFGQPNMEGFDAIDWVYSGRVQCMFVRPKTMIPIPLYCRTPPPEDTILRALGIYIRKENVPVHRIWASVPREERIMPEARHWIRLDHPDVQYDDGNNTNNHMSATIPFNMFVHNVSLQRCSFAYVPPVPANSVPNGVKAIFTLETPQGFVLASTSMRVEVTDSPIVEEELAAAVPTPRALLSRYRCALSQKAEHYEILCKVRDALLLSEAVPEEEAKQIERSNRSADEDAEQCLQRFFESLV